MIVCLFGQPHSGKSTLASELMKISNFSDSWFIDGDDLRKIFQNTNYTREGRLQNLNRASDIAHYLNSTTGKHVILSLVYPYEDARNYLNSLTTNVKWIYLSYEGQRGREKFHVSDFEIPKNGEILKLNTSISSIDDCLSVIQNYLA